MKNHNYTLAKPISFKDEPRLVNPQYSCRTLGELVAMARATGQRPELMPNVTVRKGVYLCGSDPAKALVPARDRFDKIDQLQNVSAGLSDAQAKLSEANKNLSEEKYRATMEELNRLRAQFASINQNSTE